ncbi:MAG: hypothetical protein HYX53_14090 [Chloroflexi bacterium]|nr:hypothetical protein [Chloroflexota bacterium]
MATRRHAHIPPELARDPVGRFLMGLAAIFQKRQSDDETAADIEALLRKDPPPARDLTLLPGEQVRQLIDQAWEFADARAVPLAIDALRLSPWTPEAWTVLASTFEDEPQLTMIFATLGVLAAKKAMKPGALEQMAGHAWESAEGREYLEALQNLAEAFAEGERLPEAYHRLDEMLRMDPEDHLRARYELLPITLQLHDLDYAEHLVETFAEETLPSWLFLAALTEFARWGDTAGGRERLAKAEAAAPGTARFLVSPGLRAKAEASGEYDAMLYADAVRDAFRAHAGSIGWVEAVLGVRPVTALFRKPGQKKVGRKGR